MAGHNIGIVGLIGRFKPLHNGGALMLEHVCRNAEHVKIGIGSCNKYDVRNPFTAEESREMVDAYLKQIISNYEFIIVPDFGHIAEYSDGQKWKDYIVSNYGALDHFVSGNPYVAGLLKEDYDVIPPAPLIPRELWIPIKGTEVRVAMAQGRDYKKMVPEAVADYLEKNGLVERFRKEFGLETLARFGWGNAHVDPDAPTEKQYISEA